MRRGTNPKKPGPINPSFRIRLKRSGRARFAVLAAISQLGLPIGTFLALIVAMAWAWDFTVDDALISVRYAHNWARGLGWTFNPGQRASDGVTPLPWPALLAPFAKFSSGFSLLRSAKLVGAVSVLAASACVLWRLDRTRAPRWSGASLLAPFPLIAWAVSGMETGIATLFVTLAACCESSLLTASILAGVATTFRPELAPWALTLIVARALTRADITTSRKALALALTVMPWAAVALLRLLAFGRAAPLALLAKPSDFEHGIVYVLGAGLACGTPLLLASRWRRGAAPIALASLVHLGVVAAVGGDWMPYARLLVPVLPALALVPAWDALRSRVCAVLALVCALGVGWRAAPQGVHVGSDRERVAAALAGLPVPVAALDVGFVAIAAGDGLVIDLGGLTDRELAALPGGQTSKRIDLGMLEARGVRAVVTWGEHGSRIVEQRIVQDARFREHFDGRPVATLGGRAVWLWTRR